MGENNDIIFNRQTIIRSYCEEGVRARRIDLRKLEGDDEDLERRKSGWLFTFF